MFYRNKQTNTHNKTPNNQLPLQTKQTKPQQANPNKPNPPNTEHLLSVLQSGIP